MKVLVWTMGMKFYLVSSLNPRLDAVLRREKNSAGPKERQRGGKNIGFGKGGKA